MVFETLRNVWNLFGDYGMTSETEAVAFRRMGAQRGKLTALISVRVKGNRKVRHETLDYR